LYVSPSLREIPDGEDLDKKGVRTMKYAKPEIRLIESAIRTVQGIPKPTQGLFDAPLENYTLTVNAYEADE
jgi:hypothetical protein